MHPERTNRTAITRRLFNRILSSPGSRRKMTAYRSDLYGANSASHKTRVDILNCHLAFLIESGCCIQSLWLKYQPRAFFRAVPECFHVSQGSGFCMEFEGVFRCHLE